jgi:hypothetical protein
MAIAAAESDEALGLLWLGIRPQAGVLGLGYWVVQGARQRGLASHGARLAVGWALREAGIARVEAWVEPENVASQSLLTAESFTREGVLRSFLAYPTRRADAVVFSRMPTTASHPRRSRGDHLTNADRWDDKRRRRPSRSSREKNASRCMIDTSSSGRDGVSRTSDQAVRVRAAATHTSNVDCGEPGRLAARRSASSGCLWSSSLPDSAKRSCLARGIGRCRECRVCMIAHYCAGSSASPETATGCETGSPGPGSAAGGQPYRMSSLPMLGAARRPASDRQTVRARWPPARRRIVEAASSRASSEATWRTYVSAADDGSDLSARSPPGSPDRPRVGSRDAQPSRRPRHVADRRGILDSHAEHYSAAMHARFLCGLLGTREHRRSRRARRCKPAAERLGVMGTASPGIDAHVARMG